MAQRTILCIFPLLVAFCSAGIFSERGFEFVQREYGRAITEYHAINQTVMHIRATGCKGPITYTISQSDTPFKIDAKGRVWLVKPLNYDKAKSYHLNVSAVGGNGKCVATTQVDFEILNMNKHAPQFQLEQYTCDIIENTRELRLSPTMRVLDSDRGEAGQVKRVAVVESGLPFAFTVDSEGYVQGRATVDMNAEDVTDYFFDIIAWDGGNPPKSSYPVSLECEVLDVNEFSPKFTKDLYGAKIQHGMTYDNILQLIANDDDIGVVNGHVCKYIIQEIDIPFKISQSGVISLDQPLGPEADDLYEFQVDAVDCGGKISIKSATVSITVENLCHEEIIGPSKHELTLQQCTGKVYVVPDITLNECARKAQKVNFTALVHLETKAGKGCDRDTYEASDLYTMCGASDFIDLLPEPGTGREWTKKLKMTTELNGITNENSFFFNGKTVVNVPRDIFPEDIGDKFTISTWVKMGWSESRQVIIANTDKERLDRVHFSLSTVSNNLIFVHRREAIHASRDIYCNSEFRYKPVIFDYQWHHIVIVANGCGAKLYLDGQFQRPVLTEPNWTLHNSNLKNVLTVGALWHGKEKMYDGFFTGFLSGLVIRPNSTLSEQVVSCVVGCKEHVNVDGPLPEHFSAETIDFANIEITGQGSVADFEAALQNIVYINERMVPTPGKRSVKILSMFNSAPLATVSVDVAVAGNTRPVITVRGCKNIAAKKNYLKETGVPVCQTLEIDYEGCESEDNSPVNGVHYLDAAVVKVDPPFKKGESFNFPKGVSGETRLKEIGLAMSFNDEQLVIRGIAHFSEYEEVLREMVYINFLPEKLSKGCTFSISVSTLNGKCVSDKERLELSVMHQDNRINKFGIHAAQINEQEEQMPGFVSMEAGFGGTKSGSLSVGIMAVIIICSLSIFIFLVVLGIYKYRKRPDTVKVVPPGDEKEEMYWDDTGLSGVRITLNPLQKFQELDLNEDGNNTEKSDSEDEEGKAAKGLLEWDNSDI